MSAESPAFQKKPPVQLTLSFDRQFGLAHPVGVMPSVPPPVAPVTTTPRPSKIAPKMEAMAKGTTMVEVDGRRKPFLVTGCAVKVELRIVGGIAVALNISLAPSIEPFVPVKAKRTVYTSLQKSKAVSAPAAF